MNGLPSLLLSLALAAGSASAAGEEDGVRTALEHYLKGHATGDSSHMRLAFLPTAHIEGIRAGKFVSATLDQYCAGFSGKPLPDEAAWRRTIDTIEQRGTAAMARVTLTNGAVTTTDYFVLLKVDGQWKIANKVWTRQPPR